MRSHSGRVIFLKEGVVVVQKEKTFGLKYKSCLFPVAGSVAWLIEPVSVLISVCVIKQGMVARTQRTVWINRTFPFQKWSLQVDQLVVNKMQPYETNCLRKGSLFWYNHAVLPSN